MPCLIEFAHKNYRPDVAIWIESRLKMLMRFVNNDVVTLPTCLSEYDELARRLVIGLLYVLRSRIALPIIIDDALSFIINVLYNEAFNAMMRPYIFSINKYLQDEILQFNPVIIAPGGNGGFYRLAHPYKYVVLFDGNRWELPLKDIEKIAYS